MRLEHSNRLDPFDDQCDPGSVFTGYTHPEQSNIWTRFAFVGEETVVQANFDAITLLASALVLELNSESRDHINKLVDCAVTGRRFFASFARDMPDETAVIQRAGLTVTERNRNAAGRLLDRAYRTAMSLRFGGSRESVDCQCWGELDAPHRPIDVFSSPLQQFDLTVNVGATRFGRSKQVQTRFVVGGKHANLRRYSEDQISEAVSARKLLDEPRPRIPPDSRILLYLHGHSSRLEEASDLFAPLGENGFTVISFDMPCCGYASMFDHRDIAADQGEVSRGVDITDGRDFFPLLDFHDQFVIDFVRTLDRQVPGLADRIEGIIGGSLGGNLCIRLSEIGPSTHKFLHTFICWSPASAWNPKDDLIQSLGPSAARAYMRIDPPPGAERQEQRHNYFTAVYHLNIELKALGLRAQPQYWYRDDWPCKPYHINASIMDRKEIYNQHFRRWHWRIALEQLIFSHRTNSRFQQSRGRVRLMAGVEDDHPHVKIFSSSRKLAALMSGSRGDWIPIANTGHSFHNERPSMLAQLVSNFLPPETLSPEGNWSPLTNLGGGWNGSPTVGVNEDGRLEVFATNYAGRVMHRWQSQPRGSRGDGHFSSDWALLEVGLNSIDTFGTSIAVERNHDGRLELFSFCNEANSIAHVSQTGPNSAWGSWNKGNDFGRLIGSATDSVATTQVSSLRANPTHRDGNPTRLICVAAIRSNGAVHFKRQEVVDIVNNSLGIRWRNGLDLGQPNSPRFVGTPSFAEGEDGLLRLFCRDREGHAWVLSEVEPDRWQTSWVLIEGALISSDIFALRNVTGAVSAFSRSQTGEVLRSDLDDGHTSFGPWQSFGGSCAPGSSPVAALDYRGRLVVFCIGADGHLRRKSLRSTEEANTWTPWLDMGGLFDLTPSVKSLPDGRLAIVCRGRDQSYYFMSQ